jgi:F420-dependent oxidoreductase-like protein
MKFGSQIIGSQTNWEAMLSVAKTMDAGRWDSIWTFDHFVPPLASMGETEDCLEGWMTLAGIGASTTTLRLGTVVSGNTYRNPALLAKMAATLDVMTGGRAILGIGAGWHVREHEAYGWEFPSLKERSDRLEEACELIRLLLHAKGAVDFNGKYYTLDRAPFAPRQGGSNPVPIMVGGGGEKRTLRTLARHGDIMNLNETPGEFARKVDVLNAHCEAVGRDPSEIIKTIYTFVALQDDKHKAAKLRQRFAPQASEEERRHNLAIGNAEHIVEVLQRYVEAGADEVIIPSLLANNDFREYERLDAEVLSAFD